MGTPRKTAKQLDLSQIYWTGQPRFWRERSLPPTTKKKAARGRFLLRLTEMCAKRAMEVCPCAEDGKHAIYVLTLQAGANQGRLFRMRTVSSGMSTEDEANLNAFGVPSNPLLVDAIPRQWQSNFRQQIGSKQRARANTDSPGLI